MKLRGPNLRRTRAGFNLIEVSLALAICSVGLITLIGLIPAGTDASRRASDDTMAAAIASDLLNWPRIAPYGVTPAWPSTQFPMTSAVVFSNTFDAMGNQPNNEDGSANPFYSGPYFIVTCTVMPHPQFVDQNNIARLNVAVAWPANASAAAAVFRSYRCFVGDYANH